MQWQEPWNDACNHTLGWYYNRMVVQQRNYVEQTTEKSSYEHTLHAASATCFPGLTFSWSVFLRGGTVGSTFCFFFSCLHHSLRGQHNVCS